MPKANKHAEVKPSKYKTSLCQFFVRGDECPYAGRCAFAHGEHELQSEPNNVELLKATGLQRLDIAPDAKEVLRVTSNESHSQSSNCLSDSATCEPLVVPEAVTVPSLRPLTVRPRRRMVMVSLPKQNTRSEMYQSPYNVPHFDPSYSCDAQAQRGPSVAHDGSPSMRSTNASYADFHVFANPHEVSYCECSFSATCSPGQPAKYRHNPYALGRIAQCA